MAFSCQVFQLGILWDPHEDFVHKIFVTSNYNPIFERSRVLVEISYEKYSAV